MVHYYGKWLRWLCVVACDSSIIYMLIFKRRINIENFGFKSLTTVVKDDNNDAGVICYTL